MTRDKPTRAIVVSDQAIYLRGMVSLVLSLDHLQLVGQAVNSADTLQLCQLAQPDLVLLDLRNPNESSFDTVRSIHHTWPEMKVILLVDTSEESQSPEELDEMSLYYLSRDVTEEEFKAAVAHIREDKEYLRLPGIVEIPDDLPTTQPITHHVDAPTNEEIMTRELVMAGKIQADILPEEPPSIPGWDVSAQLLPARETSGDFYDFIPMGGRKLGIVVADVTDKGMGAALFMALSSTLIRTFATRFPTLPAVAMNAVNERILSDTRGGMFVTAFFAVLEPYTGRIIFANAGHPPAYLICTRRGRETVDRLRPTGMALGVEETSHWKQKMVKMQPGDYLVLYTDGITEAESPQGQFFGEERLVETVLNNAGRSARAIQDILIQEVHRFTGNAPRQDDIAIIVIHREEDKDGATPRTHHGYV